MPKAFVLGGGYETITFLFDETLTTTVREYFNITHEDAVNRHVQDGPVKSKS